MNSANDNSREAADPIKTIEQVNNGRFLGGNRCGTVVTLINGAEVRYAPPLSKKEARRQVLDEVARHGLDWFLR